MANSEISLKVAMIMAISISDIVSISYYNIIYMIRFFIMIFCITEIFEFKIFLFIFR